MSQIDVFEVNGLENSLIVKYDMYNKVDSPFCEHDSAVCCLEVSLYSNGCEESIDFEKLVKLKAKPLSASEIKEKARKMYYRNIGPTFV